MKGEKEDESQSLFRRAVLVLYLEPAGPVVHTKTAYTGAQHCSQKLQAPSDGKQDSTTGPHSDHRNHHRPPRKDVNGAPQVSARVWEDSTAPGIIEWISECHHVLCRCCCGCVCLCCADVLQECSRACTDPLGNNVDGQCVLAKSVMSKVYCRSVNVC